LVRSSIPLFAAGTAWVAYALCLPLYRASDVLVAAAVSAFVYVLVYAFAPFRFFLNPAKEALIVEQTGDETADEILLRLKGFAGELRQSASSGGPLAPRIHALQEAADKLYSHVCKAPPQARRLRKTVDYYLPCAIKLIQAHKDGIGLTDRIGRALDGVLAALFQQLQMLHTDAALDLETDITVLSQVLAREGLSHITEPARGPSI